MKISQFIENYCVLGVVLRDAQLFHLIVATTYKFYIIIIPTFRWENCSLQRLSHFLNTQQLGSIKAKFRLILHPGPMLITTLLHFAKIANHSFLICKIEMIITPVV